MLQHQYATTPASNNVFVLPNIVHSLRKMEFIFCRRVCLFVYLFICVFFVCLSVLGITYQVPSNEQFCIKLLPEVCLGPKNNRFNYGDDPDYDPDPEFGTIH